MERTQVYHRESGHMGQYEDWWYLEVAEDGAISIVHEWNHVRVRDLSTNEGTERYTLDEGLAKAPVNAANAIRVKLGL